MEVIDPFGPALGPGDCVDRSPVLSIEPFAGPDDAAVVPSEVWIFRLAAGNPDAGGAFFLLLNRKAIMNRFLETGEVREYYYRPFFDSVDVTKRSEGGGRFGRCSQLRHDVRGWQDFGQSEPYASIKHSPSSSCIVWGRGETEQESTSGLDDCD